MKDQYSVVIFAIVMAYLGVRIYQKYFKKDQGTKNVQPKDKHFSSLSKDDDYEPYSKK